MRSAVYFPEIEISSTATMRSALLMLDEVKVIVPWEGFTPQHHRKTIAAAWELVGSTMHPARVQQRRAHEQILKLINADLSLHVCYRDDVELPRIGGHLSA